jgi:hypothetical protein
MKSNKTKKERRAGNKLQVRSVCLMDQGSQAQHALCNPRHRAIIP